VRHLIPFALLLLLKAVSNLFWRKEVRWVGEVGPGDRWEDVRVVAILNHTSLYEWVFAGVCPNRFLRQIALHGVVPIAEKTAKRPLVGAFFRTVAAHVVPISRHRDHTWRTVIEKVDDPKAMLLILPEGRMMRRNGLDHEGKPMTVRGGIADVLLLVPDGKLLLAYSGGLHHVQAPGEHVPRLFRTVRMNFERVDVAAYRETMLAEGEAGFRSRVKADLEARRDRWCPATPESAPGLGRTEVSPPRAAGRTARPGPPA
jgi:1-acyl-sn-glycerol-3-phosphate acyltransferase